MAQSEESAPNEMKKVTLAEAEAQLRAATNAEERIAAQKLVRQAQAEMEKAEKAEAATAAAPVEPQKKTHIVQKGESLSLIAKQYYGDVHKWKELYEANKAVVGANPDLVQPGMELVIP